MLTNALQNVGETVLKNTLKNDGSQEGSQQSASQDASQEVGSQQSASASALPSASALKSGIVQLMTELKKDTEFKKMIADTCVESTYSAIDEKAGKVGKIIADLSELQTEFEKTKTTDFESLQNAFAKYNTDFNNIMASQKMAGGSPFKKSRRRSSSRAFRKTRGRRRSSQ